MMRSARLGLVHILGKQADFLELDTASSLHGVMECWRIFRLDANDFCIRADILDVSGNSGDQATTANWYIDAANRAGLLAQYLHADGALSGNYIRIVKRVQKCQVILFCQF